MEKSPNRDHLAAGSRQDDRVVKVFDLRSNERKFARVRTPLLSTNFGLYKEVAKILFGLLTTDAFQNSFRSRLFPTLIYSMSMAQVMLISRHLLSASFPVKSVLRTSAPGWILLSKLLNLCDMPLPPNCPL